VAGIGGDVVLTAPVEGPVRGRVAEWLVQGVRITLLTLTLVSIGAVLWQHPRTGTMAGFRHDLVSNRAAAVEVVTQSGQEISPGHPWRTPDRTPAVPYVRWTTTDHRVHDAAIGPGGFPSGPTGAMYAAFGGISGARLLPPSARSDLATWLPKHRERTGHTTVNLIPLFTLVCLVLLVAGPTPQRGTRWAWFWFAGLVPLGLGVLAWLAFERPWSRRLARTPDGAPPPGPDWLARRRTGGAGLGWGLVISIGAQALFAAAAAVL
jgi:hypothetical protein